MPIREADVIKQAPRDGMSREQLLAAQKARAQEYGIEILEGAALTFPAGFPTDLRLYGDPVNLKFPVDSAGRSANARTRFKQFAEGTYAETKSRRVVHERIVEAELGFEIVPEIDPDDPLDRLLPTELRDRIAELGKADHEVQTDAAVDGIEKASHNVTVTVPIAKLNEEKRLVTGIVLEPDEVDAQGDTITEEEIAAAAHRFLKRYNAATKLGLMHKMFGDIGVELVESFVAPFDFELGSGKVKKGSWVITIHVVSDQVWNDVKSGKLTGFSIGGVASVLQR